MGSYLSYVTRFTVALCFTAISVLLLVAPAFATAGDFLPAGLVYKATTYSDPPHFNYFLNGYGDDLNSVDTPTFNSQPIYAPDAGYVSQVPSRGSRESYRGGERDHVDFCGWP